MSEFNPLAKGNSWVFLSNGRGKVTQTVSDIAYVGGERVEKVISSDGKVVLLKNEQGLNTYEIKQKLGKLTYDPPISLAPEQLVTGNIHKYSSKVTMIFLGIPIRMGRINGFTILVGEEDVTVPAGHFSNCLKFESVATQKGFVKAESKLTIWFAKGIGEVKCEFSTTVAGRTKSTQKHLLAAVVGNRQIPEKP